MSTIIITGEFQTQTDRAVCVRIDGEDYWIPKSKIESADPDPDDCERDEEIELEIPKWIAREKEIPH